MWGFGQLENDSSLDAFVTIMLPAGTKSSGEALNGSQGNASVELAGVGAITFTDLGPHSGGPRPNAVQVGAGTKTWMWWYEPGATVNVQLLDDTGTFTVSDANETIHGSIENAATLGAAAAEAAGDV